MWRLFGQLRRLVKTHAFRLASLYFAVFAVSVLGVLLSVYWMSADFVERQTQATLEAEIAGLAEQYAQRGLSGLVQIVAARSAGDRGDGNLYLVTNAEGHPLAGNITGWPDGTPVAPGPVAFSVQMNVRGERLKRPAQGALIVIPDGYRLLVARDILRTEVTNAEPGPTIDLRDDAETRYARDLAPPPIDTDQLRPHSM